MVNSVQRLEEMKTFVRMSSGLNIREVGWYADGRGSEAETSEMLKKAAGIVQGEDGDLGFGEWNCRAGQNNVIVRTDGTWPPVFPCTAPPSIGATSISSHLTAISSTA